MRILNAKKSNNDINITLSPKAAELTTIMHYGKGRGWLGDMTLKPLKLHRSNCST